MLSLHIPCVARSLSRAGASLPQVALDDLQALLKESRGVFEKLAVRTRARARAKNQARWCAGASALTRGALFFFSARAAQEGNLKLGSWQMVLWQPRWVHAETDALCYQKITADERPIGKEKRIEFSNLKEIEELEYGEFVMQCKKRDYTFKCPDEKTCQVRGRPSGRQALATLRRLGCPTR